MATPNTQCEGGCVLHSGAAADSAVNSVETQARRSLQAPKSQLGRSSVGVSATMSMDFDVIIVGAGPAGIAAAVRAAKLGLSHLVLERGEIANTIFRYQKRKFVMAEPPTLGLQPGMDVQFEEALRED